MSARYVRPVLCRLCDFPALDGGVRLPQLVRRELYEWCLRVMDTDLDKKELEKAIFCSFCVADARFEIENAANEKDGTSISTTVGQWDHYYLNGLIQPCAVRIPIMSSAETALPKSSPVEAASSVQNKSNDTNNNSSKVIKMECLHCNAIFRGFRNLQDHVLQNHPADPEEEMVECSWLDCNLSFGTAKERNEHFQKEHRPEAEKTTKSKGRGRPRPSDEHFGCPLCPKVFKSKAAVKLHKQVHNKNQNNFTRFYRQLYKQ